MEITLTKGKKCLVDNSDFNQLSQHKWCVGSHGYALRGERVDGKIEHVLLHRQLLNAPPHLEVDHINGNRLDNRRSNLRLCTLAENRKNRALGSNNKSGVIGVYWEKGVARWTATISRGGKSTTIGRFKDKQSAVKAREQAERLEYQEFRRSNLNYEVPTSLTLSPPGGFNPRKRKSKFK